LWQRLRFRQAPEEEDLSYRITQRYLPPNLGNLMIMSATLFPLVFRKTRPLAIHWSELLSNGRSLIRDDEEHRECRLSASVWFGFLLIALHVFRLNVCMTPEAGVYYSCYNVCVRASAANTAAAACRGKMDRTARRAVATASGGVHTQTAGLS